MAILHKLMADGGFLCGDTETGMTAYAYPTSTYAVAARKKPEGVAAEMIAHEHAFCRTIPSIKDGDARHMAELQS